MELSKENQERLKRVVKIAVPTVLGAVAVKNILERGAVKHVSYWEASQSFIIDIIPGGVQNSIRLSGQILHGPGGRNEIEDVELYQGFEYSADNIETLERAFPAEQESTD